ncbi:MAG: hypothetical protein KJ717_08780 [Proteobacteria bacterium]|nr:hypothetical protein [Pseudomonadota bacterium]
MRRLIRLILAVVLAFLSGCASMPAPISTTEKVDPSKGILLAGLTSDGSQQVMDVWFFYRLKGTTEERRLDAFGVGGLLSKPNDFAESGHEMGRLIALPVEPGEYELFNWTLYVHELGGYAYLSPKTPPAPHVFKIQAGSVTYIGGLHVVTVLGKNLFGIPMAFGGNPDIKDQSARDLAILKTKYPTIADWPILMSVPDGSQWKVDR